MFVATFPLLNLPIKAILNTIRTMDYLEIFAISLLSENTKSLVESLNLKTKSFEVSVSDHFEIDLKFSDSFTLHIRLYYDLENKPFQELGTPRSVHIKCGIRMVISKVRYMNVKGTLEHLKRIFHSSITKLFFEDNCERFSLESVHKNVEDVDSIYFLSGNHEHNIRILSVFQPACLEMAGQAVIEDFIPRYISIQNFNVIRVANVQTNLDDLLMTNSRLIHLTTGNLPVKMLNQFLKLWIKGSNLRLEGFFIEFRMLQRFEEAFDGLEYQDALPGRARLFKTYGLKTEVIGGRDIRRFDGTQATVGIIDEIFVFFVWHDHCIVNSINTL